MSLTITTVLSPPSLDDLDNWADLDHLAWSLDSEVWEACGIYALAGTEAAQSSAFMNGGMNVNDSLAASASGTGTSAPQVVRECPLEGGEAQSSDYADGGRECNAVQDGYAVSGGTLDGEAEWGGAAAGSASSSEALMPLRITPGAATASAQSGEALLWQRAGWGWEPAGSAFCAWEHPLPASGGWTPLRGSESAWTACAPASGDWTPVTVCAGPYEAVPGSAAVTIRCAGLIMREDFVVRAIPGTYGRVSFNGSTLSVT